MSKNRDYTGLERTPSSMAWLIRAKASQKGKLERLLLLQEGLPAQIIEVQQAIAAIDAVIPMHVVQVDPEAITGIRPHRKALCTGGK